MLRRKNLTVTLVPSHVKIAVVCFRKKHTNQASAGADETHPR